MRRAVRIPLSLALALTLAMTAANAVLAQEEEDAFVFQGRGWGHGVGMAQYGARVLAEQHGWAYPQILNHYYRDTGVGHLNDLLPGDHFLRAHPTPLWVGLAQHQTEVVVSVTAGSVDVWQKLSGSGQVVTSLSSGGSVRVRAVGDGRCQLLDANGNPMTQDECVISITPSQGGTRFRLAPMPLGKEEYPLPMNGSALRIRPGANGQGVVPTGFHVSQQIDMETYLYGLGEIPSLWGAHARRAQATAARSYAARVAMERETLPRTSSGEPGFSLARQDACWCHLFGSILDQNYVGWAKQAESGGANWVQSVDETAGQVVTTPAQSSFFSVIRAFYFSSSGGHTENSEDVFSSPFPYLKSTDDPYSIAPAANNPFASWEIPKFASEVVAGLADLGFVSISQVTLVDPPPGARLEFVGEDGSGATISRVLTGAQVRNRLGLRSGYVTGIARVTANPFTDITGSIHEADILTLWRADVTQGCWTDRYCPDDPVTRWQMAVFLVRALGLSTEGHPDAFWDDNGHPFEAHINAVAAAGISNGCGGGGFCAERATTRAEMAAFLLRAYQVFVEEDHTSQEHLGAWEPRFEDVPDGQWYSALVVHLAEHGITNGCNPAGTRFCPDDLVTRAQMASFLVRTFGLS